MSKVAWQQYVMQNTAQLTEYALMTMSNSKPALTSHSTSPSLIRNAYKATVAYCSFIATMMLYSVSKYT